MNNDVKSTKVKQNDYLVLIIGVLSIIIIPIGIILGFIGMSMAKQRMETQMNSIGVILCRVGMGLSGLMWIILLVGTIL